MVFSIKMMGCFITFKELGHVQYYNSLPLSPLGCCTTPYHTTNASWTIQHPGDPTPTHCLPIHHLRKPEAPSRYSHRQLHSSFDLQWRNDQAVAGRTNKGRMRCWTPSLSQCLIGVVLQILDVSKQSGFIFAGAYSIRDSIGNSGGLGANERSTLLSSDI